MITTQYNENIQYVVFGRCLDGTQMDVNMKSVEPIRSEKKIQDLEKYLLGAVA